jgi:dihydroorotate dehydrogenase
MAPALGWQAAFVSGQRACRLMYSLLQPLLFQLAPETAHKLTISALKYLPLPKLPQAWLRLRTSVLGLDFPTPIGVAAGFDKNAEVPDAMIALGFGFAEVGTVTPRPQSGNDRPRVFRLPADRAIINRLGFNNAGLEAARDNLKYRRERGGIVGANVGANKESVDRIADYEHGIRRVLGLCDYITINISSPNTVGLRALQSRSSFDELVLRCVAARGNDTTPMLVKIAPDITDEDIADIADVARTRGVDGLIVSNTTIDRPPTLRSVEARESGGLSGKPLLAPSTRILAKVARHTQGKIPLIGVGGIASGVDAYEKIRHGASLVQLYTALIYEGPMLGRRIARDLDALLARDGFANVSDAVGVDIEKG